MPETAESLASRIREEIRSGNLPEGAKLPSISEIMDRYNIGRGAAQQALTNLRAEGTVASRRGAGYYVAKKFARINRVSPDRLSKEHRATGKTIQDHDTDGRKRSTTPVVGYVVPPPEVASALGVAPDVEVLSRSRKFTVDERFVQLSVSYLPIELTRGTRIEHTDPGPGGTYGRLAEQGLEPTLFEESLIARAPLPEEVEGLGMPRSGAVVIEITRLAFAGVRCVEVNHMVLEAAAYRLTYRFSST